ncbi:hypothetical protein QTO34_019804 [Cnephaeus nilssonii]|uniref:Glyceraldehyde-3-phosphate dehydrogenase n=1 Tax=Cnephaeus nilssonii TaxID=3371016 RepID=A0AA40HXD3_CNENI|nr:hypothetical protein QTO34_019804 [Eptesicus nilssonii]
MTSSLNLTSWYMFQSYSTHGKFNGSAKAENRKPKFVMGVKHEKYDDSLRIVSNASRTTNCLAHHGPRPSRTSLALRLWVVPLGSCGVMAEGLNIISAPTGAVKAVGKDILS